MISAEQNELMTRIGPGTPCGRLLRRYWQPVGLVDEMQGPRPVKAVRLMGENLVLFKYNGKYGLVDRKCLETPAEPQGSRLCEHVRLRAYPVQEKSGILFAYLGEPSGKERAPAFPNFD